MMDDKTVDGTSRSKAGEGSLSSAASGLQAQGDFKARKVLSDKSLPILYNPTQVRSRFSPWSILYALLPIRVSKFIDFDRFDTAGYGVSLVSFLCLRYAGNSHFTAFLGGGQLCIRWAQRYAKVTSSGAGTKVVGSETYTV
jgi:hypothetical protein